MSILATFITMIIIFVIAVGQFLIPVVIFYIIFKRIRKNTNIKVNTPLSNIFKKQTIKYQKRNNKVSPIDYNVEDVTDENFDKNLDEFYKYSDPIKRK